MEGHGVVAGLGAFSFWLFIAAIVVAGIWSDAREKQARQQTIRDLLNKSDSLDEAAVQKLVAVIEGDSKRSARSSKQGLEMAYKIMLPVAGGLVFLGLMVGAFVPMLGVGGLVACVAYGLLMASRSIEIDDETTAP
jgi:Flp pilus assembly protein TadB